VACVCVCVVCTYKRGATYVRDSVLQAYLDSKWVTLASLSHLIDGSICSFDLNVQTDRIRVYNSGSCVCLFAVLCCAVLW